ncbi:MAG TPA: c-type cytochrome domain-containing protein, partial [Planctomycetota bacterium]|nr:c-type cytochrome domain-containing protein [Planctomycetota bacterium]
MLGFAAVLAAVLAQDAGGTEFFESRIRPLLVEHCLKCHGEKKPKGSLRLDSRAGWEKGGETGPALVPRKAAASLLVKMIRGEPGSPPQMPPERPLPAAAVADLVRWIDM